MSLILLINILEIFVCLGWLKSFIYPSYTNIMKNQLIVN